MRLILVILVVVHLNHHPVFVVMIERIPSDASEETEAVRTAPLEETFSGVTSDEDGRDSRGNATSSIKRPKMKSLVVNLLRDSNKIQVMLLVIQNLLILEED